MSYMKHFLENYLDENISKMTDEQIMDEFGIGEEDVKSWRLSYGLEVRNTDIPRLTFEEYLEQVV